MFVASARRRAEFVEKFTDRRERERDAENVRFFDEFAPGGFGGALAGLEVALGQLVGVGAYAQGEQLGPARAEAHERRASAALEFAQSSWERNDSGAGAKGDSQERSA